MKKNAQLGLDQVFIFILVSELPVKESTQTSAPTQLNHLSSFFFLRKLKAFLTMPVGFDPIKWEDSSCLWQEEITDFGLLPDCSVPSL